MRNGYGEIADAYYSMDAITLRQLESAGEFNRVESYLARSLTTPKSEDVYKYAVGFFIRRAKPAKSLECYAQYLAHSGSAKHDAEAVALAIDCARRLEKFTLVREYYRKLDRETREKLPTAALLSVAHSLIQLAQLDEAETIVQFIRHRSRMPQLLTFDALVEQKFGNLANARAYIAREANNHTSTALDEQKALTLALAHMAARNYTAAESLLLEQKRRLTA